MRSSSTFYDYSAPTLLTIALLLQSCYAAAAQADTTTPAVIEQPSAQVQTALVKQQAVSKTILAYGIIEPESDKIISLSLPHAGLINKLWVRLGQRVTIGDKLIEIVTAPEARMQYFQAQSAVEYAKQQLARSERMFSEQLATKADVEMAKRNLHDSQTTLDALVSKNQNKSKQILFAPMNGIITQLNLTQGDRVPSDTTAMLIASENHFIARVGIEPDEINSLTVNTNASVSPVFEQNTQVATQISEIHPMVNPTTHLIDAILPIPLSSAKQLVLGSRIIANFQLPSTTELTVPRSAVLSDEQGFYIFLVSGQVAHKTYITKGYEQAGQIVISGQVKADDTVVIVGNYVLQDGMKIRKAH